MPKYSTMTCETLPKQFIDSLRTLFEILDEKSAGFVYLKDVESLWAAEKDGISSLPSGLLESLRVVCPPNGRLTFDEFLSGVKLALSKRKASVRTSSKRSTSVDTGVNDLERVDGGQKGVGQTVVVPPNNALGAQRTHSFPQLQPDMTPTSTKTTNVTQQSSRSNGVNGNDGFRNRTKPTMRRHTITDGVSYTTVFKLKQCERERDILQAGLDVVDETQRWFQQQLDALHEKQSLPHNHETDSERLRTLSSHVTELSSILRSLHNGTAHSQVRSDQGRVKADRDRMMEELRAQNMRLMQDLRVKDGQIAQLEKDKSQLIYQLFSKNASVTSRFDDTTFI